MTITKLDRNVIKFNSASTLAVALLAFLFGAVWLVGLQAVVLAASVASPQRGLFRLVYQRIVVPQGWLRPNIVDDDPAPHRFTQGVASAVLALSWGTLTTGFTVLGWALTWLVIVLAFIYVVFDFCAGCFVYYQLRRVGLIKQQAEAK